jgi:hypothetical protein
MSYNAKKNESERVAKGFPRVDQQKMSLESRSATKRQVKKDETCTARECKGNRKAQRERKGEGQVARCDLKEI